MFGDWFWIISPVGAILWRLGGSIKKALRRYLWPLAMLFLLHRAVGATILMIGALHLGYGENHPIWRRIATGVAIGLPFLLISLNVIIPISISCIFLGTYTLSRKFNGFTWGWVEMLTGATQGFWIAKLYFERGV